MNYGRYPGRRRSFYSYRGGVLLIRCKLLLKCCQLLKCCLKFCQPPRLCVRLSPEIEVLIAVRQPKVQRRATARKDDLVAQRLDRLKGRCGREVLDQAYLLAVMMGTQPHEFKHGPHALETLAEGLKDARHVPALKAPWQVAHEQLDAPRQPVDALARASWMSRWGGGTRSPPRLPGKSVE